MVCHEPEPPAAAFNLIDVLQSEALLPEQTYRARLDIQWMMRIVSVEEVAELSVATAPWQEAELADGLDLHRRHGDDVELLGPDATRARLDSPTYLGAALHRGDVFAADLGVLVHRCRQLRPCRIRRRRPRQPDREPAPGKKQAEHVPSPRIRRDDVPRVGQVDVLHRGPCGRPERQHAYRDRRARKAPHCRGLRC